MLKFDSKLFLINETINSAPKNLKFKNRCLTILPNYVGSVLDVHNGKNFIKILIKKEMVGHKLGEFAQTRKIYKFKRKNK